VRCVPIVTDENQFDRPDQNNRLGVPNSSGLNGSNDNLEENDDYTPKLHQDRGRGNGRHHGDYASSRNKGSYHRLWSEADAWADTTCDGSARRSGDARRKITKRHYRYRKGKQCPKDRAPTTLEDLLVAGNASALDQVINTAKEHNEFFRQEADIQFGRLFKNSGKIVCVAEL
jgi:hypothetical protein